VIFSAFFAIVCVLFFVLTFGDKGREVVCNCKRTSRMEISVNEVLKAIGEKEVDFKQAPMAPMAPLFKSVSPTQKLRDKITILAPKYVTVTRTIDLRRSG